MFWLLLMAAQRMIKTIHGPMRRGDFHSTKLPVTKRKVASVTVLSVAKVQPRRFPILVWSLQTYCPKNFVRNRLKLWVLLDFKPKISGKMRNDREHSIPTNFVVLYRSGNKLSHKWLKQVEENLHRKQQFRHRCRDSG